MSVQSAIDSTKVSKETVLELYKRNPLEALQRLSLLMSLHYDIDENAYDKNLVSIIESYAEYLWNFLHAHIDEQIKQRTASALSEENVQKNLSYIDVLLAGNETGGKWNGPSTWDASSIDQFQEALKDLSLQNAAQNRDASALLVAPISPAETNVSRPVIVEHEEAKAPAVPAASPIAKNKQERQTTKQLKTWLKKSAPVIFGVASGAGLRMTSKFVIAALLATKPVAVLTACVVSSPIAAGIVSIASAFVLGATIGGLVQIGKVKYWGSEEEKQGNWKRRAFNKGAISGGVGALIGWGVSDVMQSGGHLHHLWNFISHHSYHHAQAAALSVHHVSDSAANHANSISDNGVPHNPVAMAATAAHGDNLSNIVDSGHLARLSAHTQSLLRNAHNASSTVHACKEASYELINGPHRDLEGMKAAKNLIAHALNCADQNHLANNTVRQLHSDMAFMLSRGHEGAANKFGLLFDKGKAVEQARLAKTVFSKHLLQFLKVPVQG